MRYIFVYSKKWRKWWSFSCCFRIAWQKRDMLPWHHDRCGKWDSAGRNIMMCSKYAMTFKFSSLFALLSRTPRSTLKGNDKMYFFSYFISEFDKQLGLYLVSSLLAMCCDVTRASSGKTENSCFVWLKFARVVQMMNELSSPNWSWRELYTGECGAKRALLVVSRVLFEITSLKLLMVFLSTVQSQEIRFSRACCWTWLNAMRPLRRFVCSFDRLLR